MKIFYKTRATATGGRSGHTKLDDGTLALDLAVPGSGQIGANPEQLFALGYAACFDNALPFAAKQLELQYTSSKTSVEVGMGMSSSGGYVLDIDLCVEISGFSQEDAEKVVVATHQICPYSNATRGNIDVRIHTTTV